MPKVTKVLNILKAQLNMKQVRGEVVLSEEEVCLQIMHIVGTILSEKGSHEKNNQVS